MDKNKLIIIILIIMVIVLSTLLVFMKIGTKDEHTRADFIKNVINVQAELSYYVANTYSETFGIYNKEELILGIDLEEKQTEEKDLENTKEEITPLANKDKKIEKNSKVCYEAIAENFSKVLNINLPEYEGITWYIQDGELLRVDGKPSWWTSELDCLLIGK